MIGLGATTWAITGAGTRGWADDGVLTTGLVAVLAAVGFVARLRSARDPLVPPELFRSREFTVTNSATVLLYAALGVSFFLVAYQLQVSAGWSALRSGTALLPATLLMLVGSSRSGALAERIGPRLQLTVGPLVVAAGLVLLAGVGPDARWLIDVAPGATVFGLGLVAVVAPLTSTVMGSVDPDHVSTASGVNNAVARTAGLSALSAVPVVSGLVAAEGAVDVTAAYHTSVLIAAGVAAGAAPLALLGLPSRATTRPSARRSHCAVDGPPLQPDPARCPTSGRR